MKASSLFAITIAVLLGLGAVVAARYTGIFEPREAGAPPPPPPNVLVASQNLFEGITITGQQVKVRPAYPYEIAQLEKNRDKYLPPLTQAALLRVTARNIPADTPLTHADLEELALPEDIRARVGPWMRSVNVSVAKEDSAGGLLRVGDYVDVYLTSKICSGGNCDQAVSLTAPIARNVKIVVKRNMLWTVMASNPDGKPLDYTLRLNPYRAALVEFAKNKGKITLVASPMTVEDMARVEAMAQSPSKPSFTDEASAEYRDEDQRIDKLGRGELVVGDGDLERVFQLQPMDKGTAAPPITRIVRYSGLRLQGTTIFNPDGSYGIIEGAKPSYRPNGQYDTMGYHFSSPSSAVASATRTPGGG